MTRWDETFDVIVVGAGFAGLTAAIEASNAGARVVVLEKMKAPGGNSIISDGGVAAAGTRLQEQHGIEDSPELFYNDMLKAGLGLNHPGLLRVLTQNAAEAFRWSEEYLGVEYMDRVDRFGGHSVNRCYAAAGITGATIIRVMLKKVKELGIPLRKSTCLEKIIFNGQRVSGLTVREGYNYKDPEAGRVQHLQADRAVILTTGGFGADVEFRAVQDPRLTGKIDTTNKPFATAEVLVEAMRLGAAPVQLSHIQLGAWASPDEKGFGSGPQFADYIGFLFGIIVHPDTGKRFVNEQADRRVLGDAILNAGRPSVCISDHAAVEHSGWDISRALERNVVRTFDTLEGLAAHYGLSADALSETITKFNDVVEAGVDDEYGRPILHDSIPINRPPFYAMRLWPKVHYTMGGLQINEEARVIDLDHRPVPGLYAAGEVTGGVHGACRLGSCAITDCLVFGRMAGRNAAG
ncbi:MAG: flavocytochrome c [Spirochaetota bacterium]